ncbi:MAG: acyl-CoA/acyl-ACP dehydrogenase [Actinobacteria bacterium]|nr:acyl-CoA/acyl-ACP dehydrogenase [Actinomycetota bacterium]MCG2795285.1 acyl-CoA/acyl-ACP dehydrogenase [Actinomycetes bacterium]
MFDFLMNDEQKSLQEEARDFARSVDRQYILDLDAEKIQYPKEILQEAGRRNLLGLRFPEKYGGRGLGWTDEIIALEEIATLGIPPSCLYGLVSIVGECINEFGNEEQKERYLKPTLEGKKFCSEALTEPRGGSDFFGATTTARKEGDHYILHGQKRFIVGAEGADYFMVYAKTDPDAADPRNSLSCFLVDRNDDVEVKHVYGLMGARGGGTGRVLFRDTRVPAENLVGEENGAGRIFYRMMVPERITSAAGAVGGARASLEVATRYSTRRMAFGQRIKEFQAVSFKIAESITELDAARGLVYATARALDSGIPAGRARRMVSESKKFATEMSWHVINHCMQVMGGIGYTNVYPIERALRDCRLIMIWTGTNEVMNLIIQHEFYKEMADGKAAGRDTEFDAPEAFNEEEKIFE